MKTETDCGCAKAIEEHGSLYRCFSCFYGSKGKGTKKEFTGMIPGPGKMPDYVFPKEENILPVKRSSYRQWFGLIVYLVGFVLLVLFFVITSYLK